MEELENWAIAKRGPPRSLAKGLLSGASLNPLSSLCRALRLVALNSIKGTNVSQTISLIPKLAFWDFWLLGEGLKLFHRVQEHFMESFHLEGH